jgi:thiol-disulfide isomerase/thioredoxin
VPIQVNLVDGTVVGSELNNKLNQYEHLQWELDQENLNIGERLTSQQHDSISSVFNHQIAKPEKGVVREAFDQYEEIFEKENEKRRRAVYENLDNMIPALYLFTDYTDFSYEELCELMQEDRPYANHYKMQDAWEYFMNLKLHHNGMTFNDCELVDKEGAVHRLSEYAGKDKYVLIDFWASWCAPCIAGIPKIDEIRQMFEPKGLVVLGISIDEDDGAWKAACDRLDCSWLKFRNYQKDGDLSVCNAFGVRAVPLSVLIAPDGTIVAQGLGDWHWKQKLNEIFDKE